MAKRYTIKRVVFSPKGCGDFPNHEGVSYRVYDAQSTIKGPINVTSTLEAAEERIRARKRANMRRKRNA
jgi:hypothetical protein